MRQDSKSGGWCTLRMDGMIGGLAASKLQELAKKTDSETSDRLESGHVPPKGKPDGTGKWSGIVKEGSQAPTPPSRPAIQWSASRTFFLLACDPTMVTRHINKLDFGQFLAKIIPNPDDLAVGSRTAGSYSHWGLESSDRPGSDSAPP